MDAYFVKLKLPTLKQCFKAHVFSGLLSSSNNRIIPLQGFLALKGACPDINLTHGAQHIGMTDGFYKRMSFF